jgi:integrative and conjugative element protein (TIGR02256 family)
MSTNALTQIEYCTKDRKFGVIVLPAALEEILAFAAESAGLETGGIALGRYSECHTYATVDKFTGPPTDSKRSKFIFVRGVHGLQALIAKLWKKERRYYLGEWHFHPGASANPSGTDLAQMIAIANDVNYACPEPLLFIIGGDPRASWELKVLLTFPNGKQVELQRTA